MLLRWGNRFPGLVRHRALKSGLLWEVPEVLEALPEALTLLGSSTLWVPACLEGIWQLASSKISELPVGRVLASVERFDCERKRWARLLSF